MSLWVPTKELVSSTDVAVVESGDQVSLDVQAIRDNAVEAGTPSHGDAYVYDSPSSTLVRRPVAVPFIADTTASTVASTAAETTILSATKDIAANTLQVGEQFEMVHGGTVANTSGGGATLTIRVYLDSVDCGVITSYTIPTGRLGSVRWEWVGTIKTIGSTGVIVPQMRLTLSTSGFGNSLVSDDRLGATGGSTIDTTQALTLDLRVTLSVSSASFSYAPLNTVVTRTPPP